MLAYSQELQAKQASIAELVNPQVGDTRARAIKMMLLTALGSAGVGAGAATAMNLPGIFGKPKIPSSISATNVDLPEKEAAHPAWDFLAKGVINGQGPSSPLGVPLVWPGLAVAAGTGLAGGSALVNYLIDKKRKRLLDEELSRSKDEYSTNVLGTKPDVSKVASALDEIYDRVEKMAAPAATPPPVAPGISSAIPQNLWGPIAGAGITGAGLIGLFSALGGWRQGRDRTNDELLGKAIKQKEYLRSLQSPQPVQVSLTGDVDNNIESPQ